MKRQLLTLALTGVAFAAVARANTITYTGTSGSTDGNLSASASFVTSAGQVQVTLSNTLAADLFVSPGQALSDLSFTLSNAAGTKGTATATGQEATIGPNGLVTYMSPSGSPSRFIGVGGGAYTVSGSSVLLEAIGGGTPSELIAPFEANGGTFANANNGINNNFDPYTIGSATFTLDLAGVTSATDITAATFSFGTSIGEHTVPGTSVTPEPSSLMLLGTGVLGAAGMLRRRFI